MAVAMTQEESYDRARSKGFELARRHGQGAVEKLVRRAVRQSIRISLDDAPPEPGKSKFGGTPDLAEGMDWPKDGNGAPLQFLAQVSFGDLVEADLQHELPASGHLYFFAHPEFWGEHSEGDRFPALYAAACSPLTGQQNWRDLSNQTNLIPETRISF